jgi:hypothetical protein
MQKSREFRRQAFRFSLKALLLLIVPISAGFAALRDATGAWLTGVFTITLLALLASIVATFFDSHVRRSIWGGFAICCGSYFLLVAWSEESAATKTLATTKLNGLLLQVLHPQSFLTATVEPGANDSSSTATADGAMIDRTDEKGSGAGSANLLGAVEAPEISDNFRHIAQCLWALLFGVVGAVSAQCAWVHGRALRSNS